MMMIIKFSLRIVDGQILDETEYPLPDLKNLTLEFNLKIKCSANKLIVNFNDANEAIIHVTLIIYQILKSLKMNRLRKEDIELPIGIDKLNR